MAARVADSRKARTLLIAAALYLLVFCLRLIEANPESALGFLYVIPIVILAIELGARAGTLAAAAAFCLTGFGNLLTETSIGALGYFSRGTMLVLIGVVAGRTADRMRDAIAQARAAAQSFERERDFREALLESLDAAVLACDARGRVTFVNQAARELRADHESLLEWSESRVRAPDGSALPFSETPTARALRGEAVRHQEVGLLTGNGIRTLLVNGRAIVSRQGVRIGAVVAGDDISERKGAEDQLRYLADHDPLSGVFNRRRFETELARELAHHAEHPGYTALLVLDVDDFKVINDNLGHATGDAVIAGIGDALTARLRSTDVVGRLGGDEFAAMLRRTTLEEARGVAASIQERVASELADLVPEPVGPLSLSVGIATLDDVSTLDADAVVRHADRAMYTAKRRGGGLAVSLDRG